MGSLQSTNSIEITPYGLFQTIRNESDKEIIRLIKNNPMVASLAFSFATAKDLSNTNVDNQDKCNCSDELERCLPTTFFSIEEMISRFENCLKTGCCPHVLPLEDNDASRTVSGFYWIHLAIILNNFTLFKELTPFFLMSMNKSNMNWFTVDNGYSVLYLLLVHNRSHMLLEIIKYIDQYEIKGEGRLADNAGYDEAIKMNHVNVLRVIADTNRMKEIVIKDLNLALDSSAYESLDLLVNYQMNPWHDGCDEWLDYAIRTGDVRLTRIMMNAFRKQGCPVDGDWHVIQYLMANKVLERELPIVQAIVDTRRESNSEINLEFEQSLLTTTFHDYPLIQWATELEMSTEIRQFLIEAGFTPEGTSKISEGPMSILSLVIDQRKWAFEDVKYLIRKGHDVNKGDISIRLPFHVALKLRRFDIAKLLLLNGAQPLPTYRGKLFYFIRKNSIVETLYVLITCNCLLSVAVGGETLLRLLLTKIISPNPSMDYKDIILLILDKTDIFCYEDRKAILDYRNDKSLPNEILEKIRTILYEPDSLMNICRKRLHRHYRCHFHRFIGILIEEAFPKSITDYIQCKDLLLKYYRAKDIEYLDNRLAGIF